MKRNYAGMCDNVCFVTDKEIWDRWIEESPEQYDATPEVFAKKNREDRLHAKVFIDALSTLYVS